MNKESSQIAGAVVGGVLGIIVWASDAFGADFGIGPLIFIGVMAWGGSYVFAQLFHDSSKD